MESRVKGRQQAFLEASSASWYLELVPVLFLTATQHFEKSLISGENLPVIT